MFSISQNVISISRGEYASTEIQVKAPDGAAYNLTGNDRLYFNLKASTSDIETLIPEKRIYNNKLEINEEDTSHLPFGTYKYDITLILGDGRPKTIIEPTDFRVLEVVRNGI